MWKCYIWLQWEMRWKYSEVCIIKASRESGLVFFLLNSDLEAADIGADRLLDVNQVKLVLNLLEFDHEGALVDFVVNWLLIIALCVLKVAEGNLAVILLGPSRFSRGLFVLGFMPFTLFDRGVEGFELFNLLAFLLDAVVEITQHPDHSTVVFQHL